MIKYLHFTILLTPWQCLISDLHLISDFHQIRGCNHASLGECTENILMLRSEFGLILQFLVDFNYLECLLFVRQLSHLL